MNQRDINVIKKIAIIVTVILVGIIIALVAKKITKEKS